MWLKKPWHYVPASIIQNTLMKHQWKQPNETPSNVATLVRSCTNVMANACHHLVDLDLHAPTSVRSPARLQELALGCLVAPQNGIEQDMTGPYWCSFQLLWRKLQRPTTTLGIAPKNGAKVCRMKHRTAISKKYQTTNALPMHRNAPIISHLLCPIAVEALVWIAALTMASANLSLPYIRGHLRPPGLLRRIHGDWATGCILPVAWENLRICLAPLDDLMHSLEHSWWGNTVSSEGNDAPPPPFPLQAASVVKMQIQALHHELAFGLQSITK